MTYHVYCIRVPYEKLSFDSVFWSWLFDVVIYFIRNSIIINNDIDIYRVA